ncbi:hypothetical protein U9M48_023740 [Paspalum notatum var. saurae]|uniref:Uncharacterized protein n=1 Tax=Paspalum notatum var. saurae TaxID=547442 RepID=A0AAQ3TLC2_PASNO
MPISTEEPEEVPTSSTHWPILLLDSQLVSRGQDEAKALRSLHQKTYALTKCFDEDLLVDTCMREEFNEVFQAVGWSDFAEMPEGGIVLLTKELLMMLRTDIQREGIYVWLRLFNTDYELTLRQFSNLLDFSPQCTLSEDLAGFNSVEFWKELVGPDAPRKKSIAHIRHPTLQFLARWLTMVVFPRDDIRCATVEDVRCLYAMWKKIKFAPTLSMIHHWQGLAQSGHIISIMSFVTRIINELGVLANATVSFMPNDPTRVVKESHFIHAHFLRKDTNGKYIMTFKDCNYELPLLAPLLKLYSMRSLNFQLEPPEPPRNSVAGVMTRAQRRRAEEQIRKAYEDAQQPGAKPAWAHPSAGPS